MIIIHCDIGLLGVCQNRGSVRAAQGALGSLSNDDGDVNKNGKKAIGLDWKTTTLHLHHAFLYISLPSQHDHEHDYDVKMPNFTFYGGLTQATWIWFLGIQLQESSPKFDKVS